MGKQCAAYGCNNNDQDPKLKGKVSFHKFPFKNGAITDLVKQWTVMISRKHFVPTIHAVVCSEHFEEGCFKYQNFTGRRELILGSIPTKFRWKGVKSKTKELRDRFPLYLIPVSKRSLTRPNMAFEAIPGCIDALDDVVMGNSTEASDQQSTNVGILEETDKISEGHGETADKNKNLHTQNSEMPDFSNNDATKNANEQAASCAQQLQTSAIVINGASETGEQGSAEDQKTPNVIIDDAASMGEQGNQANTKDLSTPAIIIDNARENCEQGITEHLDTPTIVIDSATENVEQGNTEHFDTPAIVIDSATENVEQGNTEHLDTPAIVIDNATENGEQDNTEHLDTPAIVIDNATENGEREAEMLMNIPEGAGEIPMNDEDNESNHSQPSEGIIINAEGMDQVQAFDSETPQYCSVAEGLMPVVKSEPLDPDEDTILADLDPSLSLTQSALQLQFTASLGEAGTLLKQEPLDGIPERSLSSLSFPHHGNSHASSSATGKIHKKLGKKLGRPPKKLDTSISHLGKKMLNGEDLKLQAKDLQPFKATHQCLVCSAPCIITRNRKIPSLPFCRKCKKAYFYKIGQSRRMIRTPHCSNGRECVIHYRNGTHCSECHHDKFLRILRGAQAAFRGGTDVERPPSSSSNPMKKYWQAKLKGKKKKNGGGPSSLFVNDQQLIQEALNSYPLVVLDKMAMEPNKVYDTKDLPEPRISPGNSKSPATVPKMFAMPFVEDIVKHEVPSMFKGPNIDHISVTDSASEGENPIGPFQGSFAGPTLSPPKLGPIKIPFFGAAGNQLSGQEAEKRGRGRPKKKRRLDTGPSWLNSSSTEPHQHLKQVLQGSPPESKPVPKKLAMEEKDVKIFVLPCQHACSACNTLTAKQWLERNGYPTVDPLPMGNSAAASGGSCPKPPLQADSSLYHKFVEFYNAVLMSSPNSRSASTSQSQKPPKTAGKRPTASSSWAAVNHASPSVQNQATPTLVSHTTPSPLIGQPPVMLLPSHPQFMDLTSPPASVPNPAFNKATAISFPPSSSSSSSSSPLMPRLSELPVMPPASQNALLGPLQAKATGFFRSPSSLPGPGPNSPANANIRAALNSHLMSAMRMNLAHPSNRFMIPPHSFPVGPPLQVVSPSSSVRQPGAPYFLSPSSNRGGSDGSNKSSKSKMKRV